jgi:hypothetical protein
MALAIEHAYRHPRDIDAGPKDGRLLLRRWVLPAGSREKSGNQRQDDLRSPAASVHGHLSS